MVTFVAKLLVLINTFISLAFAAIAFGIYTTRIDWPGTQSAGAGGKASQGEFQRLKAEVTEAEQAAGLAEARCQQAQATFVDLENRRDPLLAAYERNLKILEGTEPGTVQILARKARGGEVPLGPNGEPLLQAPPRPLLSRAGYLDAMKAVSKQIRETIGETDAVAAQEKQKTIEISGIPGKQKGLRDLMEEERIAKRNASVELESLLPIRYNYQVESNLLHKRQLALSSRLNELRNGGVARQSP